MGRNYIKKFTKNNKGYKTKALSKEGTPGTPQSMTILPGGSIAVFHNQNNNDKIAHCRKYNQKGYISGTDTKNTNLGHCNGATYCPKTDLIYCTGYSEGGKNSKRIVVLNTNFKQKYMFDLPVSISAIAYDKAVDKFYCAKGRSIYVFPSSAFRETNRTTSYVKYQVLEGRGQDVGAYNGIIYRVVHHHTSGDIDLYKHSTGQYLGSIKIGYSETESCDFNSAGELIYMTANQQRAIHWTHWKPIHADLISTSSNTVTPETRAIDDAAIGTMDITTSQDIYNQTVQDAVKDYLLNKSTGNIIPDNIITRLK